MSYSIYDLKLHEGISINTDQAFYVTRVPGGWLYEIYNEDSGEGHPPVFVPFSREFEPLKGDAFYSKGLVEQIIQSMPYEEKVKYWVSQLEKLLCEVMKEVDDKDVAIMCNAEPVLREFIQLLDRIDVARKVRLDDRVSE